MRQETLTYGIEILAMLNEIGDEITIPKFEEMSKIKGKELKELLRHLDEKGYIRYKLGLFVNNSIISESTIKLLPKGIEVNLDKRDYFNDESKSVQTIHTQTNVNNSSKFQVAQNTGDASSIIQVQDNSKINILRQIIENDEELGEPKKKKLFGLLEKFNNLKEGGENAYELIKQVGLISIKYLSLFFGLLH